MQKIISLALEMVLIVSVACAIGAVYNSVSGNGLKWTQTLFRSTVKQKKADIAISDPVVVAPDNGQPVKPMVEAPAPEEALAHTMQSVSFEEAEMYFEFGLPHYVFVDARSADSFDEYRIKGALHLYLPQVDKYLDAVRSDLETADGIIVYCNGGSCTDSITLAESLVGDYGFVYEKVFVYEGGVKEWKANQLPAEGTEVDAK